MDQQQFKIGMSVSTKLLLTISILLATPIFFINISAISLFQNDKKAYIYDGQATAAVLAGREFVSFLESGLSTLKLVVGTTDLGKPLSDAGKATIQFYLDNQRSLIGLTLYSYDPVRQVPSRVHQQFLPSALQALSIEPQNLEVDSELITSEVDGLTTHGYSFKNISRPGRPPTLAILFSDFSKGGSQPVPIAVGYVNLSHFQASGNSFNRFVIADRAGDVLFASDEKQIVAADNIAKDAIFSDALISSVNAGAKEYISPRGVRTLGSFYKPGLDLYAISLIDYDEAMKATYTLTEKFLILGLASLGVMIVLGLVFSKRVTAPLHRLFLATAQVSAGNFKVNLPVSSHDEIGALTASFVAMSHRISDLVQGTADKVRVDQELEIVKTVQQSLFPPPKIENDQLMIVSHYQSAAECGGDWWGYFRTGDKHTIIIADATGHGLSSALMTAAARSCFSVIEKLASDSRFALNPAEMLSVANRVVFDSAQGKIMMTAFVCILDFANHTLTYASAAQNPPWLFRKENGAYKQISLVASGPRLGEVQEIHSPYDVKQATFEKDDTIIFYTDGLLDGKSQSGQPYGKKQARRVIEDAVGHEPQTIIANLISDFLGHNAGKKLDDDVTLAVVRILS